MQVILEKVDYQKWEKYLLREGDFGTFLPITIPMQFIKLDIFVQSNFLTVQKLLIQSFMYKITPILLEKTEFLEK